MPARLHGLIVSPFLVASTAGPLPYDLDECQHRRDEFRTLQAEVITTGFSKAENRAATPNELENMKAMRFECEYRDVKPSLGDPA